MAKPEIAKIELCWLLPRQGKPGKLFKLGSGGYWARSEKFVSSKTHLKSPLTFLTPDILNFKYLHRAGCPV